MFTSRRDLIFWPSINFGDTLVRVQLHGAIYRPDSFALMLRYCASLKAIRYESTSLNRIVADKSHRVIVALDYIFVGNACLETNCEFQ